jgi:hypothetical protein
MLSGLHITASLHQPPGNLNDNQSSLLPVTSATNYAAIAPDVLGEIRSRLTRLELEVFKGQDIRVEPPEINISSVLKPDIALPLTDKNPTESSGMSWSYLVDEIARRLDCCAGQPSVNECVFLMRELKRDLVSLSKSLANHEMTEEQSASCLTFLRKTSETSGNVGENREKVECQPVAPKVHVPPPKETVAEEKGWKTQVHRIMGRQQNNSNSQRPSQKKWGPCFYCPCTDWRPGHTCEGSRLALLRRKERETRGT